MTTDSSPGSGMSPAKGLWGGRFEEGMAPEMVPLNLSLHVDQRLWRQDVTGSKAWARALSGAGILTEDEAATLVTGLDAVSRRIESEGFAEATEEDIHSVVERMLREEVGTVAGKLHTGRSRNDQSSTGVRLFGMEAADAIERALIRLGR
ncbi:MAG: lyase family protein, partial [Gemmatimonadota bacterium]|nr:lyase family protein [Gemmatimonadota bacterium]